MRIPAPVCAVLLALFPLLAAADAREDELFAPAEQARGKAEAVEAALLAPGAYGRGIGALERARRDYRGGADEAAVVPLLADAGAAFDAAARAAAEAQRTFAGALARREAAREAEAFRLAGGAWVRAESALTAAAQRLEKTDVEGALKRAGEAAGLYAEAELQAIKTGVLTAARARIVEMEGAGAARAAPKTAARARSLLAQAEAELDADRTRREAAAKLAGDAEREARHAMAVAAFVRATKEADTTPEDLVLEWEGTLGRAAAAAGAPAEFADGPRAAGDAVAAAVARLRQRADEQAVDLGERTRQAAALEEEIRELDARLAGASSEARSLSERLEARERSRAQFEQVEKAFPTDQAVVFRQGDSIIVRVHGLAFASGSSSLPPSAKPLLERLRDVVAVYPRAVFMVEGHTDSTGDSGANQRLSQSRAEAVRRYMVETLQVPEGRVTAVGFGDSRPIAKNESAEGRRQNRRIDLVIEPREQLAP